MFQPRDLSHYGPRAQPLCEKYIFSRICTDFLYKIMLVVSESDMVRMNMKKILKKFS